MDDQREGTPVTGQHGSSRAMISYAPGDLIPGPDVIMTRRLGAGGQGEVILAWNEALKSRVVLKLLNPELVGHDAERMFQKEARLMTQLRHRNIVRVVHAGWTREEIRRPYYIMDEEPGAIPLSELIASRTPFAVSNVLSIGIQVCDALHKAHTLTGPNKELLGAIHRDLKPANLLIMKDDDGNTIVKLLDFGIAWALYLVVHGLVARAFHGTVAYASPEQHIGRAVPQSDLYSLCVVLYELLAERHPFWDAEDVNDMMALHRFKKARPLTEYVVGLPASVVALIAKNLDKDPTKRSRSAAELKADLILCAQEVDVMKKSRALDQVTTDNMLIEKQVEARKEANDRYVDSALAAAAERTGASASTDWYQTDPGGPPVAASPRPSYASIEASTPVPPTKPANAALARPAAGTPAMGPPRILRGADLAPGTPLVVPPKPADVASTEPDPPRPASAPPAEAVGPTPGQRAKMRAAETRERPHEDLLPPPTERVNPDGSTKRKSTGTTPLAELPKIDMSRRARTAFMVEAPALPWWGGIDRFIARGWLTVSHPIQAWNRWKHLRELDDVDEYGWPKKKSAAVASARIGKGLVVLAAVAGVMGFAWIVFQRHKVAAVRADPIALPASVASSPTVLGSTPHEVAPVPAPVAVSAASAPMASTSPSKAAPRSTGVPIPPKAPARTAPTKVDMTQPAFPPAPKRTGTKPAGESPNVGF